LCITAVPLFSEEIILLLKLKGNSCSLTVNFLSTEKQVVLTALEDGLKSQIIFQIKVYEKRDDFFSFLGDRLVSEYFPTFIAYKDFFDNTYIIEDHSGKKKSYSDTDKFLNAFFSLKDFIMEGMDESRFSSYYVVVSVQMDSVRLIAPFTLLYLFPFKERFSSQWVRKDFIP
jgi:hypothetical protein